MRQRFIVVPFAVLALTAGCAHTAPAGTLSRRGADAVVATGQANDNGISALTPAEIVSRALTALAAAKTVHLTGKDSGGSIDIQHSADRSSASVSMFGVPLEVRILGTEAYFKTDQHGYAFLFGLDRGPALGARFGGKWVHAKAADPRVADVLAFVNPASEVKPLTDELAKGAATTVDGAPAITVEVTKLKSKLYVATTGEPRPLRIEAASNAVSLVYDQPVTVEAPPAADVVEFTP